MKELSDALMRLRAALLSGNDSEFTERVAAVREYAKLPAEYEELSRFIIAAADKTEQLIALGETEHACALVDAVHALPEIAVSPKRSCSTYKKCFVKPYAVRFKDNFFERFDLRLIIK